MVAVLPPLPKPKRGPSRGPAGRMLATGAACLVLCTWLFHSNAVGVLEVQLAHDGGSGGGWLDPRTERRCWGLFRGRCEEEVAAHRAAAVRAAMQHAWAGYKAFAWGADEIHPQSKTAKTDVMGGAGIRGMGVSLVDSQSTLKVMGLDREFHEGRNWIVRKLSFERNATDVSFFEVVIRILGGLAAAADLSGDAQLAAKAVDLADRLLPAFYGEPTGLISNVVSLPRVTPDSEGGTVILAEMGSNVLEFATVGALAGDPKFREAAERPLFAVHAANEKALMLEAVDRETAQEVGYKRGVGAGVDSYYEYLIKYWVLGGRRDEHFRQRWENATDEALEQLMVHPPGWDFSYVGDLLSDSYLDTSLEHLRCFYPGSVALGVMAGAVTGAKAARYLEFAANMTTACFQLYNQTTSGLGAERIDFDAYTGQAILLDTRYWQRPEVIESIFYMWRATHDQKWRDMGWRMWRAIQRHCRWEGGYSGALDTEQLPVESDDVTQSWFMAETLKYFYLLFSPDSALPLHEWVLNTEAHPLRVRPRHTPAAATATPPVRLRPQLKGGIVAQS